MEYISIDSIGYKEKRKGIVLIGGFQPIFSKKYPKLAFTVHKMYITIQKMYINKKKMQKNTPLPPEGELGIRFLVALGTTFVLTLVYFVLVYTGK